MRRFARLFGIWMVVVLAALLGACNHKGETVEPVENTSSELSSIDSVMWRQPDSALVMMLAFSRSPVAKSLDGFEEHYCQMLISELLFKNDYGQSNRESLRRAVAFFDSIVEVDDSNSRRVAERNQNVFFDARAHYINGVGFFEQNDLVSACSEYFRALEMMESHFDDNELTGNKALFLTYSYNRLMEIFSSQYMMDPAIFCGERALLFCRINPTSSTGVANILYRLGKEYDKMNEVVKAGQCYSQALESLTGTNSLVYRDIVSSKALLDYKTGNTAKSSIDQLKYIASRSDAENERLNRYFTIGGIFFEEGLLDSVVFYLKPVFENSEDDGLRVQAANYLCVVFDSMDDKEQTDVYLRFLTDHKKSLEESQALVSKLEGLYKTYTSQKQEKEYEEKREKTIRKTITVVIPIALTIAITIVVLARLRRKKMEAERLIIHKEKEILRQDLQQREERVNALEKALNRQCEESLQRRTSFLNEAICQHILNLVHGKHFTARDSSFMHRIALKEEDLKLLKEAVARHYGGFDNVLLNKCPVLKPADLSLCHLYLLGLNEGEIGALRNRTYSAIRKQNDSLRKKLGLEVGLSEYVWEVIEGLYAIGSVAQNEAAPQKSTLNNTLKGTKSRIVEIITGNPNVTIPQVASQLGLNPRGIAKHFKELQDKGIIRRVGPDRGGHWEVVE